jgi:signal transduction histidine kinase
MRSVTHHLSVMIDEILAFSSLEAGRERVRAVSAPSGEVLEAAAAVVEPLARQKGIGFEVVLPAHQPIVLTDVDKVRQILVNLAGNAVKFTDRGVVRLALEPLADGVRYTVSDTGVGIADVDRDRLFQPFTQLDAGLTRRHGGTGLGLYISQRLADLVGGRIDLTSEPGAGSTFALTLPMECEARE